MAIDSKEKSENKTGFAFNLGSDKLNLGSVIAGVGGLIDLIAKLQKEGKSEYSRTGEISGLGSKNSKGVYGFSIKLGGFGSDSPQVETFGNIKKDKKGSPVVDEVREPLVDLFDEADKIVIIAEIPGVDQDSIKITLNDDILELNAEDSNMKYRKEILLPSNVQKGSLSSAYKNGILKITLIKSTSGRKESKES